MKPILCLNAGSSSLKFALFQEERRLVEGAVERIGEPESRVRARDDTGSSDSNVGPVRDVRAAVPHVFTAIEGRHAPEAVGHRLVHGGPRFRGPERLTAEVTEELRGLEPFAPLHLPGELAVVDAVRARLPHLPQVGCFDTAFHHGLPEAAQRFAVPESLWEIGVRRYGFHGLSYEYVVESLGDDVRGRWILAHLGNGASLAAVRDGASVDTTMGLTPAGGLVMGTRTGDLDPGVLTFVARQKGWDAERLDRMINSESGLRGVSGTTGDMEALLAARETEPRAGIAVELFCRSVRKHVGALAAVLGGLDGLVFTGGIGEHAAPVREEICAELGFLGVDLDPWRNAAHADVLSRDGSRCVVRRVETDEDRMIVRHTARVLGLG